MLSVYRSLDLDEAKQEIKSDGGFLYGWAVTNAATATRWIKFYDAKASDVTVGTTTPKITWGIPGNSSDAVAANMLSALGLDFRGGMTIAATTGAADNDTGAPGANDVVINVFYK